MEKIGFIGAYDKTDTIMYIAKILTEMGKKVLIVDATISQKAKYVIPTIESKSEYITNFANIDFAIGFKNYSDMKTYLGMPQSAVFTYDYMLIDIDYASLINQFDIYDAKNKYFVTSFDLYTDSTP